MIGTKLAKHYEITAHLGSGGFGDVYRASDSKLGRSVALKLLPEAFASDVDRLSRFRREAQMLASLNHPNIAQIYGLEESGHTRFIVMELVEGETLQARLNRGPIRVNEALTIAKQICEALEAAHEKGVIHRDLKPGNVMLTGEGNVKVLDFGLAKAMSGANASATARNHQAMEANPSNASLSNSPTMASMATTDQDGCALPGLHSLRSSAGVILGTAAYMSPEQAKGRTVDKRTDIFAFGCVLYEMLTGKRAFDGDDVTEILGAVVRLEPDWTRLPADVPIVIRKALRLYLEKNPRNRRSDATDVRLDIEEALKEPPAGTGGPTTPARSARLPWVAAAVFLITASVLSIPYFRSKPLAAVMRLQIVPPAGVTFNRLMMEISPDGSHLAFVASSAAKPSQLWIRSLDSVEDRLIPDTAGARLPFWSPDSRFVGFSAGGELKKVDISGGPVQTICSGSENDSNGTWNSAGVIIFAGQGGLYRVSAEGGTPARLTSIDASLGEIAHNTPQFLPDGQHFIYFVLGGKDRNSSVYAGSLDSKETTRILSSGLKPQFARPDHLLFVRDGALFTQTFDPGKLRLEGEASRIAENVPSNGIWAAGYSVAQNGLLVLGYSTGETDEVDLTWVDRTGTALSRVGTAHYQGVDLSPDGKRLATHHHAAGSAGGDVWITDLERGKTTRFTFDDSQDNSNPTWSPDGASIVFNAVHNGKFGLYRKASSGVGAEELLWESETRKVPVSWAPDGKSLVFVSYDSQQGDLWTLPLTGKLQPIPYLQTPQSEIHAQISPPDGRWIAYGSSGGIWVQSYPNPGTKWQVSVGSQPRWRADGGELFFYQREAPEVQRGALWSVTVDRNGGGLTFGSPKLLFRTTWSNQPHLPSRTNTFTYAVSPDGQKFLIPRPQSATNSPDQPAALTVILNWTSLLKK